MKPLTDERLDALLAGMPREHAEPSFTPRVLAGIDRHRRIRRWQTWTAAAAIAMALGVGSWLASEHRTRRAAALEEAALRSEIQRLGRELDQLERLQATSRPMVYLGSTDTHDIVVDLRRLAQQRSGRAGSTRPALAGPETDRGTHPYLRTTGDIYR